MKVLKDTHRLSNPAGITAGTSARRGSVVGALLKALFGLCAVAAVGAFLPGLVDTADRLAQSQPEKPDAAAECPDVRTLAMSADGRFLAVSHFAEQSHFTMTDTESGVVWRLQHPDATPVSDFVFGSQSTLLAAAYESGAVALWDLEQGGDVPLWLHPPEGPVVCVAISPDSRLVAESNGDGRIRLRDARNGKLMREIAVGGTDSCVRMRFSPSGRTLLSAGMDGSLALWGVAGGRSVRRFSAPGGRGITAAEFSPDGSMLYAADSRGTLRAWSVRTGRKTSETESGLMLTALAVSPDARRLAAGATNGVIRVLDAGNFAQTAELLGHTRSLRKLRFDAHGESLYSAAWDATVRLWDPATGEGMIVVD